MTAATMQSSVSTKMGFGVPGERFSNAPWRSNAWRINNAADNFVGRMMSVVSEGVARSGAAAKGAVLAGVLCNPKQYVLRGDGTNPLNPSLEVADNSEVEGCLEGQLVLSLAADAAIGDPLKFAIATGIIASYKKEAQFTASQATDQLTVSAVAQGVLGIGTVVKNASGEILGTIIALGTGTGGTGTYTLNTSATVGSAAMTGNSVLGAADDEAYGRVIDFTADAGTAQLAVCQFNIPLVAG